MRHGGMGELWVRGRGVIKGYWHAPEASRAVVSEDGWLRTGDLVRRGPLGTVAVPRPAEGRDQARGYSVYAREVEAALERHPSVLEAAVVGLPDATKGEVPAAAVRLADGADLEALGLEAWRRAPGAYKVPAALRGRRRAPAHRHQQAGQAALLDLF